MLNKHHNVIAAVVSSEVPLIAQVQANALHSCTPRSKIFAQALLKGNLKISLLGDA